MFSPGPKLEVFIVVALNIVLMLGLLSEPFPFCDFHTSYFPM